MIACFDPVYVPEYGTPAFPAALETMANCPPASRKTKFKFNACSREEGKIIIERLILNRW